VPVLKRPLESIGPNAQRNKELTPYQCGKFVDTRIAGVGEDLTVPRQTESFAIVSMVVPTCSSIPCADLGLRTQTGG